MVAYCKKPGNEALVKHPGCSMCLHIRRYLLSALPLVDAPVFTLFLKILYKSNEIKIYEDRTAKLSSPKSSDPFIIFYPRKDRYNRKIERFRVVIEEGETEESDLEEVERHEDTQDFLISAPTFPSSLRVQIFLFGAIRLGQEGPGPVNFKLKKGDGQSALDSSNSGSSDEEQEAEQTNGPKKVP